MYWLRGPCRDYSPRDRAQGPCSRLQIFCPAHLLPLPRHPHIFASVRICSSYISCHKRPPFFASPQLCRPDQKFHEDTCCSSQPRWTSLSSMYSFSLVYLCSESPTEDWEPLEGRCCVGPIFARPPLKGQKWQTSGLCAAIVPVRAQGGHC